MMVLRLIAVGRLRGGPEAELFDRYNARLRPNFVLTEIAEARGAPAEVKRREGSGLWALPNAVSAPDTTPKVGGRRVKGRVKAK